MRVKSLPFFYLLLFSAVLLTSAQRGGGGNQGNQGNRGNRGNQGQQGNQGPHPSTPTVNPAPTATNPSDVIEEILTEHPNTDVFATESALEVEVKSGVVVQIFDNETSFQDIKQTHQNWAEEAGVEFEFVVGDLNIEYIVEENAEGILNVIISVTPPETENEAIIVNATATVNSEGNAEDLTTTSVNTEDDMENVVVVINEPQPPVTEPVTSTGVVTAQVLGGGTSNCQEVVTCQWVNIPRVGVKKVCSTSLVCK